MMMNARQVRALVAELPPDPTCPVTIESWNRYGAILATIGEGQFIRQFVIRPDGAAFPWDGSLDGLVEQALDRREARL